MWIKIAALLALVALLWSIFRLSMGLRWAKVSRESARREEEGRGRRIVAELPSSDGTLGFFAEDHAGFYWPAGEASKSGLRGARLLLNAEVARRQVQLQARGRGNRPKWIVRRELDVMRLAPAGDLL